jgi:hypothetical protein
MSFELETSTPAKLTDVVVLSQKNRQPDDLPGAKLSIELSLANDALAYFDGNLLSVLFTKEGSGPAQGDLAPVSDRPNLTKIGRCLGQFEWDLKLTGFTMTIDTGLGGPKSNLVIENCELSNFRLHPREGGTLVVKFDLESENVSEKAFGKLATLKAREIALLLAAPVVAQQGIGD